MKKMPCLFQREFHGKSSFTLLREVTPGCEWVLAGEGVATVKRDGTACAVIGGKLYKRYDAKRGKTPPPGAIPCDEPDPVTGHWPHWVLVGEEPESKWHKDGLATLAEEFPGKVLEDGTYELCGPKLQGNPHNLEKHRFYRHGMEIEQVRDRSWEGIRDFLRPLPIEGLVFHHPDGRMCKIRRADYRFEWPLKVSE